MRQSAGTLLYRSGSEGLEVLLVHPSGWYNRGAPWSIPKGEPSSEEELEATARRETKEETGVEVNGPLVALGAMTYKKSRKEVHCFAGPAPAGAAPRCASWEIDQACFVALPRARELLHPDQTVFLDRFVEAVKEGILPSGSSYTAAAEEGRAAKLKEMGIDAPQAKEEKQEPEKNRGTKK